jgi:DNA (cytosine-5)-methyltransferase 1
LLSEVLGREIMMQLLGRSAPGAIKLLPPDRRPFPAAERTSAVPCKFLELLGSHSAHPGTGKGYGATRRGETMNDVAGSGTGTFLSIGVR